MIDKLQLKLFLKASTLKHAQDGAALLTFVAFVDAL